jgi:uncharacterized protein YjdB
LKELISKKFLLFFSLIVLIILLIGCTGITPPEPSTGDGAPVITSSPLSTTAEVNRLYFYGVKATDPDGDTLTYSLMKKPSGMYINSETGLINWRPKFNQVGVHDVMIKVTDGENSDTQSFKITVPGSLTTKLKITSTPITTVTVDELYTYQVETNYSGEDPLIFSLTVSPTGMVIDADTGEITWTPDSTQIDEHDVTVEVTDGDETAEQSFTITVNDILTSIAVLPETMDIYAYQSQAITSVTASYTYGADQTIALGDCTYTSDDETVATVSAGTVTGVAEGAATITVSYTEGAITVTDTVAVTVKPRELQSITVLPVSMTIYLGGTDTITSVTASYNYGADQTIALGDCTYTSDDETVATVSAGTVTGVAEGTANITVSYTEGVITVTDTVAVTVTAEPISTKLELTPTGQTVSSGSQVTINVEVEDVNNLMAATITINFDDTKLSYASNLIGAALPGSFFTNAFMVGAEVTGGSVKFEFMQLEDVDPSGSGILFAVKFDTLGTGTTDITFGATGLYDEAGAIADPQVSMPHTTGSGCSVTIQ